MGRTALRTAVFRYTQIFLPMYAAHLCHTNQITLSGPQHARAQALLETAQAVFLAKKVQSTKQFRIMFGSSILYNNGEWTSRDSKAPAELVQRFTRPFRAGLDGIGRACPIPPLDVAFCWLLHRLSPTAYEADCQRMFGAPLPAGDVARAGPQALRHAWVGNADHDECVAARLQWACFAAAAKRLEPRRKVLGVISRLKICRKAHEAFLPKHCWPPATGHEGSTDYFKQRARSKVSLKKWTSPLSRDLELAAHRQRTFLFNIMSSYYDQDPSVHSGVQRYVQFMSLMKAHPGTLLVPTYDIDLVWHAHLSSTAAYRQDCMQAVGRFINHEEDDDRAISGRLAAGLRTTAELWQGTFGEEYATPETSYRGKPPGDSGLHLRPLHAVAIQADREAVNELVAAAVCRLCMLLWLSKRHLQVLRHESCRKQVLNAATLARAGQAHGSACGGLYARGFAEPVGYRVGIKGAAGCGGGRGCGCGGGEGDGGGGACGGGGSGGACGGGCGAGCG
jgi:Glycine-rich domain-containing protein-like